MTNIIVALVFTLICVALYFGYTLGAKDTEFEYRLAEREARQRERENGRRFADLVRQTAFIGGENCAE